MGRNTSRRTKEPIASYTSGLQVTLNSISGPEWRPRYMDGLKAKLVLGTPRASAILESRR